MAITILLQELQLQLHNTMSSTRQLTRAQPPRPYLRRNEQQQQQQTPQLNSSKQQIPLPPAQQDSPKQQIPLPLDYPHRFNKVKYNPAYQSLRIDQQIEFNALIQIYQCGISNKIMQQLYYRHLNQIKVFLRSLGFIIGPHEYFKQRWLSPIRFATDISLTVSTDEIIKAWQQLCTEFDILRYSYKEPLTSDEKQIINNFSNLQVDRLCIWVVETYHYRIMQHAIYSFPYQIWGPPLCLNSAITAATTHY